MQLLPLHIYSRRDAFKHWSKIYRTCFITLPFSTILNHCRLGLSSPHDSTATSVKLPKAAPHIPDTGIVWTGRPETASSSYPSCALAKNCYIKSSYHITDGGAKYLCNCQRQSAARRRTFPLASPAIMNQVTSAETSRVVQGCSPRCMLSGKQLTNSY
jgi:hypothetical protein